MKQRNELLSVLLTVCMIAGLVPWTVLPARARGGELTSELTSETTSWSGDYTVSAGDVTITGDVTVTGDTTLTIADGKTLTVNGRIRTNNTSYSLAVNGPGTLTVTTAYGGSAVSIGGSLTLNGAAVTVENSEGTAISIGENAKVIVNSGTLNATSTASPGYGIILNQTDITEDRLIVNGGTVTASGKSCGIHCHTVVNGGVVTATHIGTTDYGFGNKKLTLAGGTFMADSYNTNNGLSVTVAEGYAYTIGDEGKYTGTLTNGALTYTAAAPAGAKLIAARYDNGRMTAVTVVTDVKKTDTLTLGGSGSDYKLFLVDGTTYAPLCAAWSGTAQ